MRRVYHPYWNWEDWKAGMWTSLHGESKRAMLCKAIEFTGDAALYGQWMRRVIAEWPIACEHNLTERSLNRLAWIGHAATCLAIQCPEMITREAWGKLTDRQRTDADAQALHALQLWAIAYERKDQSMGQALGSQGILGWAA